MRVPVAKTTGTVGVCRDEAGAIGPSHRPMRAYPRWKPKTITAPSVAKEIHVITDRAHRQDARASNNRGIEQATDLQIAGREAFPSQHQAGRSRSQLACSRRVPVD